MLEVFFRGKFFARNSSWIKISVLSNAYEKNRDAYLTLPQGSFDSVLTPKTP